MAAAPGPTSSADASAWTCTAVYSTPRDRPAGGEPGSPDLTLSPSPNHQTCAKPCWPLSECGHCQPTKQACPRRWVEDGPTTASPDPWLVCPELGYLWRDGPSGMPPHPLPLGVNFWSVCRGGGGVLTRMCPTTGWKRQNRSRKAPGDSMAQWAAPHQLGRPWSYSLTALLESRAGGTRSLALGAPEPSGRGQV